MGTVSPTRSKETRPQLRDAQQTVGSVSIDDLLEGAGTMNLLLQSVGVATILCIHTPWNHCGSGFHHLFLEEDAHPDGAMPST